MYRWLTVFLILQTAWTICVIALCPVTWISNGKKCYYFSNVTLNSELATSACLSYGAKLAEPQTSQETAFLGNQVNRINNGYFYIGVDDRVQENNWVYTYDQSRVLVSDWGPSEPTYTTNENCVVIAEKSTNRGHWADVDCNRHEHFICEKGPCPLGWIDFHDRCYFFSKTVANYSTAQAICLSLNSALAEPVSVEDNSFLGTQINRIGSGYFYIGVKEVPVRHSWVYLSSGEPIETPDWGLGEPDPATNENCVLIAEKPTNRGHWADVQCSRMEHFVCQKSLRETIPGIIG
ncbi:macrophage mannose receptor 1-like [Saccostrea echinata]|uniref:macrophage mannose receptor 1-like n=1 Tax=Saccostrea echinata TaxID=191078 RepID=UPI002A82E56E|nr:macrophage mannose receptor 1-like [Saccostrea echinata]